MKLHENKELFRQSLKFTAQTMQLPKVYIEKDYWVTYALHLIFKNDIGKDTIFKGGTALSKCYKIIERFSEDIDLVMVRHEGEKDNQVKKRIRKISKIVHEFLPEEEIEGLTQKMGMNRKTVHSYPKLSTGEYGQVRDKIVLEATALGYHEPYTKKNVSSLIAEMMLNNNQAEMVQNYRLSAFELKVLSPERTICEKVMSLLRFSYTENPVEDLGKKIRHAYDLHKLLSNQDLYNFFDSEKFISLLLKVAQDDVRSYRNHNQWLKHHPKEALIFRDLANVWNRLKEVYQKDFKNLVYRTFPKQSEIFETLNQIKKRLEDIEKWIS